MFMTIFIKHSNYSGQGREKTCSKCALKRTRVRPWRFCLVKFVMHIADTPQNSNFLGRRQIEDASMHR